MNRTSSLPLRVVIVIIAAGVYLTTSAAPAPATTTTFYTQGGTIDLNFDGDPEYEVVVTIGGEDHTCEDPEQTNEFIVDVTETMTMVEEARIGTAKGDGYYATYFDFGGMEWQLDLRVGDPDELGFGTNTGTITGTHPNQTITQHAILEAQISTVTDPGPPCTKGTTICHLAVEFTIDGPWDETTMTAGPLDGTGQPQVAFCDSPFGGLADGAADITDLTFDDTPPA